jgi:K+-sensing histidine kinase KdpD
LIRKLDADVTDLREQLATSEADRAALRRSQLRPVAYLMLCAAIVVLRHFVDTPPFDEINSLLQICIIGAAMMWGGAIAAITAFLFVVGIDFFLPNPLFTLGIHDWRGLIELAFGSVLALGCGISASRIFPSPLGDPSQTLGSN